MAANVSSSAFKYNTYVGSRDTDVYTQVFVCAKCKELKHQNWFSPTEQKRGEARRCRPCKNRVNTPVLKQKKSKTLSIFTLTSPTAKLAALAFRCGAAKVSAITSKKPALWRRYYLLEEQMMKAFDEVNTGAK